MDDNPDDLVSVRYLVDDVGAAVDLYVQHLGFVVRTNFAPAITDIVRGRLRLLLSGPTSSAGAAMPDGQVPASGGWNRMHLIVDDIAEGVDRLHAAGSTFRSDIVTGP